MEAALHGGELAVLRRATRRFDALALHGRREREAGQRRLVVDQHRAGAAFAAVAAGLGAGEPDLFAQVIEQQNVVGDRVGAVTAIEPAFKQTGQAFRSLERALTARFVIIVVVTRANISVAPRQAEGFPQTNSREWLERLRCPKLRDHVARDRSAADLFGVILAARSPDPGFAALDRQFASDREAMLNVEAGAAELADPRGRCRRRRRISWV